MYITKLCYIKYDSPIMSEFGERLKQARIKAGMNQQELARALEVTQAAISQFEQGKRKATPATITRMAEILGVDRQTLAGSDEGEFERSILMRNLKGLSPESLKKINEIVELYKKAEKK